MPIFVYWWCWHWFVYLWPNEFIEFIEMNGLLVMNDSLHVDANTAPECVCNKSGSRRITWFVRQFVIGCECTWVFGSGANSLTLAIEFRNSGSFALSRLFFIPLSLVRKYDILLEYMLDARMHLRLCALNKLFWKFSKFGRKIVEENCRKCSWWWVDTVPLINFWCLWCHPPN